MTLDSHAGGHRFESCRAHHFSTTYKARESMLVSFSAKTLQFTTPLGGSTSKPAIRSIDVRRRSRSVCV